MQRDTVRTLLVVDDEVAVIRALTQTFEHFPYRVVSTTDPYAALEILRADPSIDVLIADLFMPAMDGAALLEKSRGIRPGLPIILTTGMASESEIRRWRRKGKLLVEKPWLEDEIVKAVETVLAVEPSRKM
jgi:CheY-like chemotaxis protein